MISYREKQLLKVQKMLQDDTTKMIERTTTILDDINNKNTVDTKIDIFDINITTYNDLVNLAEQKGYDHYIRANDILSQDELEDINKRKHDIEKMFSKKTGITNKTDLTFLMIATAMQVVKSLVFPYIAEKFEYGESFDPSTRKDHNDKSIEKAHRDANDKYRDSKLDKGYKKGYWINILYQTVPYDITKGSVDLGINLHGKYHRLYSLGHDPILGWLFGTANILTDCITFNNLQTNRIQRIDPITGSKNMKITPETVFMGEMFRECFETIKADKLNLPAALFAQAQHLKSDEFTKLGLPVPLLSSFNENFANKLYTENYDAICFARDSKIVGVSFVVSRLFDMIISLVHGLFKKEDDNADLYAVRTRKILLYSNMIASSCAIINGAISAAIGSTTGYVDMKKVDLGTILNTIVHLLTDIPFILKIKDEFIKQEIDKDFENRLQEIEAELNEFKFNEILTQKSL